MTTAEFMLQTIQAQSPCALSYVLAQCKAQGFTRHMVQALHELKATDLIRVDDELTVELI